MHPRPTEALRPVVSSQTRQYAGKVRYGRGFTLAELKGAKITAAFARTVGISVDHRRTNTSEGQLQRNVDRLNMYRSKLILFPRRASKPKKGCINDSTNVGAADACNQNSGNSAIAAMPAGEAFGKITAEDKAGKTFYTIRKLRTDARYNGRRIKKAADAEAAKK
jgi:large subunit ribosomal protein L13e